MSGRAPVGVEEVREHCWRALWDPARLHDLGVVMRPLLTMFEQEAAR